ncbi:hypothetical protein EPA93_38860 [Ktedonosporobacter rubrisoli]|uniref:Tetratricopeptide repeat protein n=1 Tax=Ktedonosporobacter rubrisoli TaxID=2509675 RepID=A0A4P6K0A7_KTERU|nr:hypothetical protein [Ktedonosporobacter rubrisoli]QBD81618.1 hypothetical protein EPA93_38860 [Ktedonosporobacter rubrisoli]
MVDTHNLLSFDLFQQLVLWLSISMNSQRKGYRYLEANPMLMQLEAERELERLITARVEEQPEMKQQLYNHLTLLRDIRRRGKDGEPAQAIRESYINLYGGLATTLTPQLEHIEERHMFLERLRRPERTKKAQLALLREALAYAYTDINIAPEVIAEFQIVLSSTLTQEPQPLGQTEHIQALEEAISHYKTAHTIFTLERYPLQYARTHLQLGNAYLQYWKVTNKAEIMEQALRCYTSAALVYSRDIYPEQWIILQTQLGNAYARRNLGSVEEDLEYALSCFEAALQLARRLANPALWAMVQISRGDTYLQRRVGAPLDNARQAMACYRDALLIYTYHDFPREWGHIHFKLGNIYQHYLAENDTSPLTQDMDLRCAIVCYESALKIYTPDAFPRAYAVTLLHLGTTHHKRLAGKREENLAQARKCYQAALHTLAYEDFPLDYPQTLLRLAESETSEAGTASIEADLSSSLRLVYNSATLSSL